VGAGAAGRARRRAAATLVLGAAFGAGFLSFYLFMTGVWGFAQSTAGLAATAGPMAVIAVALGSTGLAARFGLRHLLVAGGVAIGLLLPALTGAALAGLKPARQSEGNAVNNAPRQHDDALGVALMLSLAGKPGAEVEGFRVVYALLAGAGLVIAVLATSESPSNPTGRSLSEPAGLRHATGAAGFAGTRPPVPTTWKVASAGRMVRSQKSPNVSPAPRSRA